MCLTPSNADLKKAKGKKKVHYLQLFAFTKDRARAAPEVMPPVFCWAATPGAHGGVTVELEPPHHCFVTVYCHASDGSRVAVQQNGI